MKQVIFDTSAYNNIVNLGKESLVNNAQERKIINLKQTHIESGQISETQDEERKIKMLSIEAEHVPTEAAVFGVSKYGAAKFGSGNKMEAMIGESKRLGTVKDSMIADVALLTDIFVSDDDRQRRRFLATNTKTTVMSTNEFVQWLENQMQS